MLERVDRLAFLHEIWDYQPGEHVLFTEPTQGGKTHLAFQLLEKSQQPNLKPPVVLVMKPRDATPARWTKRLGYREVREWPPRPSFLHGDPPGFTLWPPHEMSLEKASLKRTNENLAYQFRRALLDTYKSGDRVVFCDEIHGLIADLDLQDELIALLTRGSGMGAGLWSATQKAGGTIGSPIPGHFFSAPTHLFLGHDKTKTAQERAGDIGGIDPKFVAETVSHLRIHRIPTPGAVKPFAHVSDKLYLNKNGPYACLIGP